MHTGAILSDQPRSDATRVTLVTQSIARLPGRSAARGWAAGRHTSHNNRPASGAGRLRRFGLGRRPRSAGRPCPGFPRFRPLRLPSCPRQRWALKDSNPEPDRELGLLSSEQVDNRVRVANARR
jgi:hypothetical protein